jgi:hypothetical protein
MKLPGYIILKEVTKKRIITLGEARKLFTSDFKDKRDFFALASLYTGGYVDSSWLKEGCNWDMNKNSSVAEELYLMSLGPGKHNVDGVPEFTNERDYNLEFKIYCTAKSDLFFHEQRSKRIDRTVTLSIGILVALVTAAATAYFTITMSITPSTAASNSAGKLEISMMPANLESGPKQELTSRRRQR